MDATITPMLLERTAPTPPPAPVAAGGDGTVLAQDSARFDALMVAPTAPAGSPPASASPLAAMAPDAVARPTTLGDKILGGLRRTSATLEGQWRNVNAALEGSGSLAVRDMLRIQRELSTMTLQYELVSKVVTRSTQNIEQLVKLQ